MGFFGNKFAHKFGLDLGKGKILQKMNRFVQNHGKILWICSDTAKIADKYVEKGRHCWAIVIY